MWRTSPRGAVRGARARWCGRWLGPGAWLAWFGARCPFAGRLARPSLRAMPCYRDTAPRTCGPRRVLCASSTVSVAQWLLGNRRATARPPPRAPVRLGLPADPCAGRVAGPAPGRAGRARRWVQLRSASGRDAVPRAQRPGGAVRRCAGFRRPGGAGVVSLCGCAPTAQRHSALTSRGADRDRARSAPPASSAGRQVGRVDRPQGRGAHLGSAGHRTRPACAPRGAQRPAVRMGRFGGRGVLGDLPVLRA